MAIKSQQRIKGFIVGKLELDTERDGPPMFTARAGQEHFKRLPDGKFEKVGADYFKLLQFGDEAVDSYAKYVPGHHFIAVGRIQDRTFTNKEGQEVTVQNFIANSIELDPDRPQPKNAPTGQAPDLGQTAAGAELDEAMEGAAPEAEAGEPEPSPAEPSPVEQTRRLPTVSGGGMRRETEPVGAGAEMRM